ncbi:MAG: hypothetical protein WAX57_02340 [Minisyncoccia bacterium]
MKTLRKLVLNMIVIAVFVAGFAAWEHYGPKQLPSTTVTVGVQAPSGVLKKTVTQSPDVGKIAPLQKETESKLPPPTHETVIIKHVDRLPGVSKETIGQPNGNTHVLNPEREDKVVDHAEQEVGIQAEREESSERSDDYDPADDPENRIDFSEWFSGQKAD